MSRSHPRHMAAPPERRSGLALPTLVAAVVCGGSVLAIAATGAFALDTGAQAPRVIASRVTVAPGAGGGPLDAVPRAAAARPFDRPSARGPLVGTAGGSGAAGSGAAGSGAAGGDAAGPDVVGGGAVPPDGVGAVASAGVGTAAPAASGTAGPAASGTAGSAASGTAGPAGVGTAAAVGDAASPGGAVTAAGGGVSVAASVPPSTTPSSVPTTTPTSVPRPGIPPVASTASEFSITAN